MKVPTDHVDLGEQGYPDYWIEIPRSVKEGYLHEFSRVTAGSTGEDGEVDLDKSRKTNIKIMELVTAWNIDDETGKVFPVLTKVKTDAERDRIIAEIPVDIIVYVANRIAGNVNVPEKTKDF